MRKVNIFGGISELIILSSTATLFENENPVNSVNVFYTLDLFLHMVYTVVVSTKNRFRRKTLDCDCQAFQ